MSEALTFELEPADTSRLANLCGQFDAHLHQIEKRLGGVEIACRGNIFSMNSDTGKARVTRQILHNLYSLSEHEVLTPETINLHLQESGVDELSQGTGGSSDEGLIQTKRGVIRPRGRNQKDYVRRIHKEAINFGVGPAGTGKTYLAVACAVDAILQDRVRRIVLVRPAVEAGERLGFLPGDMAQKVDPYLRPLYDALYEMLGFDQVAKLIDRNVIEVAPLAFMRGRTLNDAFVILDEAQNTTPEQMKMFLTRIGFGSTAVVTGDVTQIDLPRNQLSGLRQAIEILAGVKGISLSRFNSRDVVRHPMVQQIIDAYEHAEKSSDD
jgi:phosphate starvation-inducible PhoH-like protein